MSHMLTFTSDAFPPDAADDEELCNAEAMHGHALAIYLGGAVQAEGYPVTLTGEDWGWYCEAAMGAPGATAFGVASFDRTEEFAVQFIPHNGKHRRLFKTIDVSAQLDQLKAIVFAALERAPGRRDGPTWQAD